MTLATSARKTAAKPHKAPRIAFARSIEAAAEGAAPHAARLWRAGLNKTDKGDLQFTERSAKLVMQAYEKRGNPLAFYYEHEDRIPLEKRGGAPMKGVCSAPSSVLAIRDGDEGPECWAEQIAWTAEAQRQIETGERRQISPIAAFDEETREIVEILNVSLCSEGATHHGTLLAGKGTSMDELMQKLMDACSAKDWELAGSILAEMASMEGGAAMAKAGEEMVKYAKMAAGDGGEEKKDPPSDDVATKKLAAARPAPSIQTVSYTREIAELRSATARANDAAKKSDKATVRMLIAANRDRFDAVDEREHLDAANPEATEKFIASMDRKAKAGLLVASRGGADVKTEAAPPKDPPSSKKDETHGLTAQEMEAAVKMKVTFEEFAAAKARNGRSVAKGRN